MHRSIYICTDIRKVMCAWFSDLQWQKPKPQLLTNSLPEGNVRKGLRHVCDMFSSRNDQRIMDKSGVRICDILHSTYPEFKIQIYMVMWASH